MENVGDQSQRLESFTKDRRMGLVQNPRALYNQNFNVGHISIFIHGRSLHLTLGFSS